jgi:hypothetical protein
MASGSFSAAFVPHPTAARPRVVDASAPVGNSDRRAAPSGPLVRPRFAALAGPAPPDGCVLQRTKKQLADKTYAADKVARLFSKGVSKSDDFHKRSRTAFGTFGSKKSRQGPHTSPHVLNRLLIARINKDLTNAPDTKAQHRILDRLKYTRIAPRPQQQLRTAKRLLSSAHYKNYADSYHKRNTQIYARFKDKTEDPEDRLKAFGQYLEHGVLQTYMLGQKPTAKHMAGKGERWTKAAQWANKGEIDEALDPSAVSSIRAASSNPKRDARKVRRRTRQLLARARSRRNDQDVLSDDSDDDT